MTYLYGDSTPSTLDVNFIEFLRDAVQFCVQVLLGEQRVAEGKARTLAIDHATAAEIEQLKRLGGLVSKALEGVARGDSDSATARCAAAIVRSATDLARAETTEALAVVEAENNKRDAEAARERDGSVKALEVLLVRHDPPDMTLDVQVAGVGGTRYGCRAHLTTKYGLDAVVDLEVPPNHLLERIVRVDRLAERLEVQAPEMGGWLHKEVKLRAQHLDKHHVVALSVTAGGGTLKLRTAADGTGPGFDVLISKEAPRVRLARVEQREGLPEPPFEVEEADAQKLLALYDALAAAASELTRHRKSVVEARFDGEPLRTHATPSLLVERLISTMAPVVQEIAARSHSPGELVLRRLLADDRREEIFLSKQELKLKLEPLNKGNRALFDPLWLDGNRGMDLGPSFGGRPPVVPARADRSPLPSLPPPSPPPPSLPPPTGAAPPATPAAGPPATPPRRQSGSFVLAPPVQVMPPPPPPPAVEPPRKEATDPLDPAQTKETDSAPRGS